MKRVFVTLVFLVGMVSLSIPAASSAFAQSNTPKAHAATSHVQMPLTNPSCYGDGLPHNNPPIRGCDGVTQGNCPIESAINSKPIGSQSQGTIGTLYLFDSNSASGCNAWHSAVKITHSGCFSVDILYVQENGSDISREYADQTTPRNVCQNQWINSYLAGTNTGGCYFGESQVFAGTEGTTVTATEC